MLQPPALDRLQNLAWQLLLPGAVEQFHTFILVLLRLSGLLFLGPIFGQSTIPPNVRILIIMMLAMIITPTLNSQARRGFERLDENGDGRLVREEVPPGLVRGSTRCSRPPTCRPTSAWRTNEYHVHRSGPRVGSNWPGSRRGKSASA